MRIKRVPGRHQPQSHRLTRMTRGCRWSQGGDFFVQPAERRPLAIGEGCPSLEHRRTVGATEGLIETYLKPGAQVAGGPDEPRRGRGFEAVRVAESADRK